MSINDLQCIIKYMWIKATVEYEAISLTYFSIGKKKKKREKKKWYRYESVKKFVHGVHDCCCNGADNTIYLEQLAIIDIIKRGDSPPYIIDS